jgi:hypothetical protein
MKKPPPTAAEREALMKQLTDIAAAIGNVPRAAEVKVVPLRKPEED